MKSKFYYWPLLIIALLISSLVYASPQGVKETSEVAPVFRMSLQDAVLRLGSHKQRQWQRRPLPNSGAPAAATNTIAFITCGAACNGEPGPTEEVGTCQGQVTCLSTCASTCQSTCSNTCDQFSCDFSTCDNTCSITCAGNTCHASCGSTCDDPSCSPSDPNCTSATTCQGNPTCDPSDPNCV